MSDSVLEGLATRIGGGQDHVDRFLAQLHDSGMRHAYKWGLSEIIGRTKSALEQERKTLSQHELNELLQNLRDHLREASKLMRHPAVQNALVHADAVDDLPEEMNALVDAIPRVIDRLHLAGRHGNVSSTHTTRLPAKIYMTVLTGYLIQSARGTADRPGRGNGLLLALLPVLWEFAGGNGAVDWERAIRTARGTSNPEIAPAYILGRREAADLVEDIRRRASETLWAEIKRIWKGRMQFGDEVFDTRDELLRHMLKNRLRFLPELESAKQKGN
jgi:hypothetical protein